MLAKTNSARERRCSALRRRDRSGATSSMPAWNNSVMLGEPSGCTAPHSNGAGTGAFGCTGAADADAAKPIHPIITSGSTFLCQPARRVVGELIVAIVVRAPCFQRGQHGGVSAHAL